MTARRSLYVDVTLAATACTIREWHPTTQCEHSEEEELRRLQTLKSDLFRPHEYDVPASQKEIMTHNHSASPLVRLPPEIRLQIYSLVLGGQQVWISHTGCKIRYGKPGKSQLGPSSQYFHRWGTFGHFTAEPLSNTNPFSSTLHLGLLRVCRQIYVETALLPYALNTFTFKDDSVRKLFEQSARPGKKRVQKKAIGEYKIGSWSEFRSRHCPGKKW